MMSGKASLTDARCATHSDAESHRKAITHVYAGTHRSIHRCANVFSYLDVGERVKGVYSR
jgi:hypothetical protein